MKCYRGSRAESLGWHQGYKGLLEPPIDLGLVSWVSGQARGQLIVLWRVRVHDCSSGDWCRWPQKFANTEYDSEPHPALASHLSSGTIKESKCRYRHITSYK